MRIDDNIKPALQAELLCIADGNWVLGHWYINCMLNGRELTDFTSIAGIAEEKLGHTRALFRFLEEYFELPEFQLEFGRGAGQVHSPEFLDQPPDSWADFIISLFLADVALWRFSATFMEGNFTPVTNLVTRFGEECYFHQLCIDGWIKGFSAKEKMEAGAALTKRLPQVLTWFGSERQSASDLLIEKGIRTVSVWSARERFLDDIMEKLSASIDMSKEPIAEIGKQPLPGKLDPVRRRRQGTEIPAGLWESISPSCHAALDPASSQIMCRRRRLLVYWTPSFAGVAVGQLSAMRTMIPASSSVIRTWQARRLLLCLSVAMHNIASSKSSISGSLSSQSASM